MNAEMTARTLRLLCTLITVALSALFVSLGIRHLRAAHEPDDLQAVPELPDAAPPALGEAPPDPHLILARNIFDPTTGPLWPPPVPEPAEPLDEEPEQSKVEPRCATELRVAAVVFDAQHPERSRASLHGRPLERSQAFSPGGMVGTFTVVEIHPRAVRLHGDDGYCWIGMFNEYSREKVERERELLAKRERAAARAAKKAEREAKAKARAERRAKRRAERRAEKRAR